MMRYQGLNTDNLPLNNGRRSQWRSCKEDENIIVNTEIDEENDAAKTIPNFVEASKGIPKFRSSFSKTIQDHNFSPISCNFAKNKDPHNQELNNNTTPLHNGGGSGDMLLQWGHRKRSRISRSIESRSGTSAGGGSTMADDSSSSSSTQIQGMMKIPRRSITLPPSASISAGLMDTKNSSNTNIMPPPSSILPNTISITSAAPALVTNSSTSNGIVGIHKSSSRDNRRNLEERTGGGSGSHPPRNGSSSSRIVGASSPAVAAASSSRSKAGKRSPQKVVEKNDQRKMIRSITTTTACSSASALLKNDEKINGLGVNKELQEVGGFGVNQHQNIGSAPSQEAAGCSSTTTTNNNHDDMSSTKTVTAVAANGGAPEVHEWPRVHIPLTRKEKEEDFLVMKGTKLPHRPKKRPKAVDRMLQYCFPGAWLVDVTKARYEVKEKKCTTKKPKRRGLKGMESMESDSE